MGSLNTNHNLEAPIKSAILVFGKCTIWFRSARAWWLLWLWCLLLGSCFVQPWRPRQHLLSRPWAWSRTSHPGGQSDILVWRCQDMKEAASVLTSLLNQLLCGAGCCVVLAAVLAHQPTSQQVNLRELASSSPRVGDKRKIDAEVCLQENNILNAMLCCAGMLWDCLCLQDPCPSTLCDILRRACRHAHPYHMGRQGQRAWCGPYWHRYVRLLLAGCGNWTACTAGCGVSAGAGRLAVEAHMPEF